ncbi:MAG: DUF3857 domain-containing transglutaminase family protein [candidate division Zixibacteria bacterium]|nr:DUF3857 domain-containing transglutaminase family protein [candidate division Zixibacteria bacterium]MBU1470911.1 DUF3857 domain-containing transglutaminase family protein [candidate division Zixibacteria bacterium]
MRKAVLMIWLAAFIAVMTAGVLYSKEYTVEDVAEMIANAPGPEMFPQAGAAILLQQTTVRFEKDYSAVADEHLVVKILQDRGKNTFGDVKRRYDSESDSLVVIMAVTHLADGTVIEVDPKAINDITPAFLANATVYSNIMQKVVSFSGIAPGVTIELKLRRFSKAPEEDEEIFIWGTGEFQGEEPILHKEMSLTAPSEKPITYKVQNEGIGYETSEADGFVTHRWYEDNSPQIIPEPFMPDYSKIAPRLIYTSATSWEQVGNWVSEKFFSHVEKGGKIEKKAKELTTKLSAPDEKISALALYVINDIRDIGESSLPLGIAGYEPNDAEDVLTNKYGDWRDKAVLLVSLLESAGIESYPVFVQRNSAVLAEDQPSLKQFNSIYVYVPSYNGQPLWINPFADHCYFGYFPFGQGSKVLMVRRDGSEIVAMKDTKAEDNIAHSNIELHLRSNGDVDGNVACQLEGYFDWQARSRLKDETPTKVDQYFQSTVNAVGEGSRSVEFKTTDLDNLLEPVSVVQTFSTPELGVVEGDMMIFHPPAIPYDFAIAPVATGEAMRFYDYVLDCQMKVRTEGSIYLPEGYKTVYTPEPFGVENEFGKWSTEYTVDEQSNAIHYVSEATLVDIEMDADEYMLFKESFDNFSKPKNSLILLEKK